MVSNESKFGKEISNAERNPTQTMDILENLPPELTQMICMFLSPDDIYRIKIHFPHWMYLINSESFWKEKCKLDNFYPLQETSKSPFYKTFSENIGHWEATYFYNQTINYNWKNNGFQEIPLTNLGPLNEIHYFDDEMFIATTENNNIKIINSSSGIVEKCFHVCANQILCISKENNILLCITDLSALIWNLESECLLNALIWERKVIEILSVCIHQNWIAVHIRYFNYMPDLFILNLESKTNFKLLENSGFVFDVRLYNNMAVLLEMFSIKFVNMLDRSSSTLTCLSREPHLVKKMFVKDEYVIGVCCSSYDVHISVWQIETAKLIKYTTIDDVPLLQVANNTNFNVVVLDCNKIAYAICDNREIDITLQVLNYITGERIFRIKFCNDCNFVRTIPMLKAWNENIIFSISPLSLSPDYDYIRMFCAHTGKLIRILEVPGNLNGLLCKTPKFTPTKMFKLKYNYIDEQEYLTILNFEN